MEKKTKFQRMCKRVDNLRAQGFDIVNECVEFSSPGNYVLVAVQDNVFMWCEKLNSKDLSKNIHYVVSYIFD